MMVKCPKCNGLREIKLTTTLITVCPLCKGTGKTPDKERETMRSLYVSKKEWQSLQTGKNVRVGIISTFCTEKRDVVKVFGPPGSEPKICDLWHIGDEYAITPGVYADTQKG
jgi:hypothetical protein